MDDNKIIPIPYVLSGDETDSSQNDLYLISNGEKLDGMVTPADNYAYPDNYYGSLNLGSVNLYKNDVSLYSNIVKLNTDINELSYKLENSYSLSASDNETVTGAWTFVNSVNLTSANISDRLVFTSDGGESEILELDETDPTKLTFTGTFSPNKIDTNSLSLNYQLDDPTPYVDGGKIYVKDDGIVNIVYDDGTIAKIVDKSGNINITSSDELQYSDNEDVSVTDALEDRPTFEQLVDRQGSQLIGNEIPNYEQYGSNVATYLEGLTNQLQTTLDLYNKWFDVKVSAITNIDLYDVSISTINGVTLVDNDRVLLPNQTTTTENGIYIFIKDVGLSRAYDARNNSDFINNKSVYSTTENQIFILTIPDPFVIGFSPIIFNESDEIVISTGAGGTGGTIDDTNLAKLDEDNTFEGVNTFDQPIVQPSLNKTPTSSVPLPTSSTTDIPTKTSDLTNDSGFITNEVDDLVNYSLTTDIASTYATMAQVVDLQSGTLTYPPVDDPNGIVDITAAYPPIDNDADKYYICQGLTTGRFYGIYGQDVWTISNQDATSLNGESGSFYLDYNNATNAPENLSDFNNDLGFIDKTVDDLDNYMLSDDIDDTYATKDDIKNIDSIVTTYPPINDPNGAIDIEVAYPVINNKPDGYYTCYGATTHTFYGSYGNQNWKVTSDDALTLNGKQPSYYLDYINFINTPENLSDFNNDVGFIDKTVDDLDNYYDSSYIDATYPTFTDIVQISTISVALPPVADPNGVVDIATAYPTAYNKDGQYYVCQGTTSGKFYGVYGRGTWSVNNDDAQTLQGYTPSYLLDYANFTDTPYIPVYTSDLINDNGYATTSTNSLTNYYNITQSNALYATKSDVAGLDSSLYLQKDGDGSQLYNVNADTITLNASSDSVFRNATTTSSSGEIYYSNGISFDDDSINLVGTVTSGFLIGNGRDVSNVDAVTLNTYGSSYYLDYDNFINIPPVSNFDNDVGYATLTTTGMTNYYSKAYIDAYFLTTSNASGTYLTPDGDGSLLTGVDAVELNNQQPSFYLDYANFINQYSANVSGFVNDALYITNDVNDLVNYYDSNYIDDTFATLFDLSLISGTDGNAQTLDNQDPVYYLDYANFTNASAADLSLMDNSTSLFIDKTITNLDNYYTSTYIDSNFYTMLDVDGNFYTKTQSDLRYLSPTGDGSSVTNVDAVSLNSRPPSFYLDYDNFTNINSADLSLMDNSISLFINNQVDDLANYYNKTYTDANYATQSQLVSIASGIYSLAPVDDPNGESDIEAAYPSASLQSDQYYICQGSITGKFYGVYGNNSWVVDDSDSTSLNGQDGSYYLDYANFTNIIAADLSLMDNSTSRFINKTITNLDNYYTSSYIDSNYTNNTDLSANYLLKNGNGSSLVDVDSALLNGQDGSYYLDYANFTNIIAADLSLMDNSTSLFIDKTITDLDNYYTSTYIDSNFATQADLASVDMGTDGSSLLGVNAALLNGQDGSYYLDYANFTNASVVDISAFNNDAGYINNNTASLTNYYTSTYIDSNFATQADLASVDMGTDGSSLVGVDADELNGEIGNYYLDYANFNNASVVDLNDFSNTNSGFINKNVNNLTSYYTKTQSDARYATAAQGTLASSALQPSGNGSSLQNVNAASITIGIVNNSTLRPIPYVVNGNELSSNHIISVNDTKLEVDGDLNVTGGITGDGTNVTNVDATLLGGDTPGHYLNYNNFTNTPTNISYFNNDSNYATLSTTALTNYYTKTQGDSRYTLSSSMSNYYTNTQSDSTFLTQSDANTNYLKKNGDGTQLSNVDATTVNGVNIVILAAGVSIPSSPAANTIYFQSVT